MRTKNWTIVGAIAAAIVAVPVAWNAIELAVAIKQTPREVVQLHDEMTNGFMILNDHVTAVDAGSLTRDIQLHKEITRNWMETRTNFAQVLQKLNDGHYVEIDPPKSADTN